METVVLMVHTLIALLIIVLVLLQRGKGADAGAAFGSGASGTVFGARGSSNFFSRATAVLATAFFVSSLALAYMSSQHAGAPDSLLENAPAVTPEPAPEEAPAGTEEAPQLPDLPAAEEAPPGDAGLPALEPEQPPADDERP
jgi:preprotein translocase subunit SecG